MQKLLYILFFMLLAPVTVTSAKENFSLDHQVQYLVDQAQFLARQGISQEKIFEILKDNIERELLNNEKPKNSENSQSSKLLWSVAGCCIVGVVIGGVVYYFFIKNPQPQQPQQSLQNNQPNQVNQILPQSNVIQNNQVQRALPQELLDLFDDNAFDQEAELQRELEPMMLRASLARQEIFVLYRQHQRAIQEHNLPELIATGEQIREHMQNPQVAAYVQGFQNNYPGLIQRVNAQFNEPSRVRRLEAINRFLENN